MYKNSSYATMSYSGPRVNMNQMNGNGRRVPPSLSKVSSSAPPVVDNNTSSCAQHDEIIRYIFSSWSKVSQEADKNTVMDDISETVISPKLLQDLLNLEKDFKFNLSLLKIKDSEIERCNAAYIDLQATLQNSQSESVALQVQQTRLQQRLDALERQLANEKQENQRVKADSCRQIDTMRQQEMQQRLDFSRQEAEVERKHRRTMQDQQDEHKRQLQQLEDRIAEKQLRFDDLQSKLQTQTQHYDQMKRDQEESSANQQRTILGYQEQLTSLKESRDSSAQDLVCVRREWNKIRSERDQYKNQTELNSSKIKDLLEDQNRLSEENGRILVSYSESETENKMSKVEINHLKSLLNSPNCSLPSHIHLTKQNEILQELVKSMKKSSPLQHQQVSQSILKPAISRSNSFMKSDSSTRDNRVNCGTLTSSMSVPLVTFAETSKHAVRELREQDNTNWRKEDSRMNCSEVTCENTMTTRKIAKLEYLVELLKMKLVN